MAKKYNLQIDAGTTYSIGFIYKSDTGVPFNLTGYTVACQIRSVSPNALVLSPTMTKVDAEGLITLSLTAVQTGTLTPIPYMYAIEISSGAEVIRVVQGEVIVSEEIVK
jgi:hypothetical protein